MNGLKGLCHGNNAEHSNNYLKLLNYKRKEKHGWTQVDKIETDCVWVILKLKVGPGRRFSNLWKIAWIKVVFCQNHLVCDVTIILSVKEFHITIIEF